MNSAVRAVFAAAAVVLLAAPAAAAGNVSYVVDMRYDQGNVTVEGIDLSRTSVPPQTGLEKPVYRAEVWAFNGSRMYVRNFSFPLRVYGHFDGLEVRSEAATTVVLPYHPSASTLRITDVRGNEEARTPLVQYASCDLDRVCEHGETAELCPLDCSSSGRRSLVYPLAAGVLALVVALAVAYLIARRQGSENRGGLAHPRSGG